MLSVPPCDITSNFKHKWQTLSLQITEDPKLSLLHIKVTQRGGEHGGESRQSHGGAEGTKSDRGVVYVLLITLVINE